MLRSLIFISLLIVASEARRCYSCTSAADCASVGVGRVQECESHTQCYTVQINGRAQLKGCTLECAHVERHSELHACHTCVGDLCNSSPSVVGHNNQDHHHHRHNRREARRHNENNSNIGSGASVGGGTGIGGGASPHSNNGNSGIGNGASVGGHGSGGIGSGASVGGNTGIGGGVAPSGSNRRHYKRTIGHGAGYDSSIGGGAAPMGGGAYPGGGWNSGSGGIGGGAVPESYPPQRNGGSQWNDDPWNNNQQGYNGIGSGARPYNSASLSSSLAALAAPLALFVFRR